MRILVVGDGNSIHLYNYIKVVLEDLGDVQITLFDATKSEPRRASLYEYYRNKNITIITDLQNYKTRIPKISTALRLLEMSRILNDLGVFDYCIIHFIEIIKVCAILLNSRKYQKIIPVFWGSDLLRNNKINSTFYRWLFNQSHKIIFNTENMKKTFKKFYGNKFEKKSEVIKFPCMSFEEIDVLKKNVDIETIKMEMGLPKDKYIVICGHAGTKEEQYEKTIDALSTSNDSIKEKCHFIFLMTYGHSNLSEYQDLIKELIQEKSIKGTVLCDYMKHDELLKLLICSDIYITTITTDAFSAVMQENLYSGSVVIYGKWLHYYELENSPIIAQSLEKIEDLGETLEKVVINYKQIKSKLGGNSELISNISSPRKIRELWWSKILRDV